VLEPYVSKSQKERAQGMIRNLGLSVFWGLIWIQEQEKKMEHIEHIRALVLSASYEVL